ncbi:MULTISPECIES: cellulose biosynthesis protein BcsS [Rhodopseudomonas]|uniref:Cellulose biosynthesis protein BcsS n=1 Tax=Rhodopseudomonas palustris TaxID=1076 RepID=A0A0D7F1K4_RHOPL|nr:MULTISPECIES: cellulose biosynthesis protein BcsS [Rhodopseudomonas]KIZ46988.1 hypothetical protein OO17_05780 [Rhodopseudomonas palustris]MDF3809836.1 cellulose biosynthesis protein BcsS [Rhodopseudomonas sp. BAL398]WOK20134.1 cellulose biosynthesis protein BcsS [Rhodopseudomonas sp. BAL398]
MAAAIMAHGEDALAQTAPTAPPPVDHLSGGARPERLLLFGGFDLWRNSLAGYGGLQWSASDLDSDGFIVRMFASDGIEHYRTPTVDYATNIVRASLLPGWRFKRGAFELKLFAGLDLEHHHLTPDVIDAPLRGTTIGARLAAEIWAQPIPELMLASSFYVTTIGHGYGARVAAGWRLYDRFWVGPELCGAADELSRQTKIGVHLTGLRIGQSEWSAAAGYVDDSYHRSGPYLRIGVLTRQ